MKLTKENDLDRLGSSIKDIEKVYGDRLDLHRTEIDELKEKVQLLEGNEQKEYEQKPIIRSGFMSHSQLRRKLEAASREQAKHPNDHRS